MRFITLLLPLLPLISSSTIPLRRDSISDGLGALLGAPTTLPPKVKSSIDQAIYISQNLGSEIARIQLAILSDPILKLHPAGYDVKSELSSAFAKAIAGIQALPTIITPNSDLPDYVNTYYTPLVAAIGESIFLQFVQSRILADNVLQNELFADFAHGVDYGIWDFTKENNVRFQGFGCALSKAVGTDNALGQAIKLVSEQTFYLLLDNIDKGKCPA